MLVGGSYYALTIGVNGADSAAYYSLTPDANIEFSQGGVAIAPTSASAVVVNIYPQTLQIQAPAGIISGGVTIVTNESTVAGVVRCSPPVNVDVLVELWGTDLIGSYTLKAGDESGAFNFPVQSSQSVTMEQAKKLTERMPAA